MRRAKRNACEAVKYPAMAVGMMAGMAVPAEAERKSPPISGHLM